MVSKILTVRNTIQDVLGIRVSLEDANEIIERLEAWQAEQAVEQPLAPDVLPCGHPKSSLVRLGFGQLPYCEDCKRQNAGKA